MIKTDAVDENLDSPLLLQNEKFDFDTSASPPPDLAQEGSPEKEKTVQSTPKSDNNPANRSIVSPSEMKTMDEDEDEIFVGPVSEREISVIRRLSSSSASSSSTTEITTASIENLSVTQWNEISREALLMAERLTPRTDRVKASAAASAVRSSPITFPSLSPGSPKKKERNENQKRPIPTKMPTALPVPVNRKTMLPVPTSRKRASVLPVKAVHSDFKPKRSTSSLMMQQSKTSAVRVTPLRKARNMLL